MQTIVFVETNKSGSSRDAIKAADEMGFFTVLFTNRQKQLEQREEYPDVNEMYYQDLSDLDSLRSSIENLIRQGKQIKTIVSLVDSYVYIASLLAEEYCHSKIPSKVVNILEDKIKTRLALVNKPYNPHFNIFNHSNPLKEFINKQEQHLPVIVKSPSSTGSKDVFLVSTKEQLENRINQLKSKYPDEPILIEEYLEGSQFLVEVLVVDNEVNIVAVIEQEVTKYQRFIVTGYSVLADVSHDLYKELEEILNSITTYLGLSNGCLHVELKHTPEGEWKVIEVNPRMSGGAMNRMINASFGINFVSESLKVWLGKKPVLVREKNNYASTKYVTLSSSGIVTKVTGKKRASRCPGVVDVYVKTRKGSRVSPPISMGGRYAYVIAVANSKEKAYEYATSAVKHIEFHLTNDG